MFKNEYILGCEHIESSLAHNKIFADINLKERGNHIGNTLTVGKAPDVMPNPSVKPKKVVYNQGNITPYLEDATLTYCQITSEGRYGVYYKYIALFNNNLWVTRDRSGATCLRIF